MNELEAERVNPSSTTVLAMFNSMVGGAMLTMPLLFKTTGMVSGSIILVVSGLISFITCRIYVIHMSNEDKDVEWTIRRLLGSKWEKRFRFITGFYLILLCVIYIDLIVDQLYSVIYLIFDKTGSPDSIAHKDAFAFDQFSTQWLSLVLLLPLLALIFIKKLHILVKLSEYGSYSAMIYFLFVVVKFFMALANGQIDLDNITWVSGDVGNLAGTCALAFTIHTMVITFVKQNKDQTKNERDLGLSYILGFLLYELIGIFGGLAISGNSDPECKETLVNCYLHEWAVLVVEVSYLFGRITVFPCTLEVSRTRLIELFTESVQDHHFKYFNIAFIIFATIMSILSPFIPISLMMNIVGAVVCYFFIYLFPTMLHYTCLYKKRTDEESLIESITSLEDTPSRVLCTHPAEYAQGKPKVARFLLYGVINAVGVAIGVYGLYTCISQIAG